MSTTTLTKRGNSIGLRIPSSIIKEAHLCLGEILEIKSDKKGVLTLTPIKNQQESWLEQFNAAADSSEKESYIEVANDFDRDEWVW